MKRPCGRPGCPNVVVSGYCDACRPASPAAAAERERGSASARGYGRAWQKYSAARLAMHPLCVDPFKRHSMPVAAECTDHIIAHKGDMKLFWDPANHQSLCHGCNSFKAALVEGGFGRSRE
jgi:5-methylcytosine-specific restriction protein A